MQTLKIVGLGLLFSLIVTVGYLLLGIFSSAIRSPVDRNHAIGLSVVYGVFKAATIFNPLYWLGIVLAFGVAFWLVRFRT